MRNVQIAALTAQLLLGTAYAAPRGLSPRKPEAAPIVARDGCDVTTYTVITPKPGMAPTPVTKQFQPVWSGIPQYVVCDGSNNNKCETMYSTTSYKWVSTAVPCYNGLCTVTEVGQPVTVAAYPTYAVATQRCENAGACYYGDQVTYVPAPTSFAYVNPGWDYYVCPFSDYYQYLSGSVGRLGVEVYSCINGVCRIYPLSLITKTYVSTSTYQVPYGINQYFAQPTIIVVGSLGITINISIAPTSISTTVTGTSTVTSTVTTTETETVTNGVTVTDTTGAVATATVTATATAAPGVGATFVLGASVDVFAKNKRQETARSFVVCSNGLCALQQNCTNAALFDLDVNGRLSSAGDFIFASVSDITSGTGPFKLGTGPVTTGFSFNGGVLSWINAAFVDGDHEASFCQNPDNSITVVFPRGTEPDNCTPLTLTRVDPAEDIACLGVNARPRTTTGASSSSSSETGSSTGSATATDGSATSSDASNTGSSASSTASAQETDSSSATASATAGETSGTLTSTDAGVTSTDATTGPTETGVSSTSADVSITSEPTTGPTSSAASVTDAEQSTTTSEASSSITSIGGNSNLEVCDTLAINLRELCIDLNGLDPCALTTILANPLILAQCVDAGGEAPNANLVGCATSTDIVQCVTSCTGLLDTLLLVQTCTDNGGTPVEAPCADFQVGEVTLLADLCITLTTETSGVQNPCTLANLQLVDVTDLITTVDTCVLGGFITDTGLLDCVDDALALLPTLQLAATLACIAL